jgi:transcriptional regulator with XRE-family HTH domain
VTPAPRLAGEHRTPLRVALERVGLSQAALARALGVDRRQVAQWVSGEYTPVPPRREQIAREVGVAQAELWAAASDAERSAA